LASWRATTDRLTSFEASFQALAKTNQWLIATDSEALDSTDLQLSLPDGTLLLDQAHLSAQAGDRILLQGPSGAGKSTLFRALAGIWPYADGHLQCPAGSMFIPQRPYFPNGPLRDALAYPQSPALFSDDELHSALQQALLPDLTGRLDEIGAWSQTLSGGEQQRLAVARVLLKKPSWIFADEATSALDEAAEHSIYKTLIAQVASGHGAIISIAHKPNMAAFHSRQWTLEKLPPGSPARFTLRSSALPAQTV
jgi:putative ATP-binding cassette transporter